MIRRGNRATRKIHFCAIWSQPSGRMMGSGGIPQPFAKRFP